MSKKIKLLKKLINHLMINGKKHTSEKILLKTLKILQKESSQQCADLLRFALTNATPIFKMHKISNKNKRKKKIREIPAFISKPATRESSTIKLILAHVEKKSVSCYPKKLKNEIFLAARNENSSALAKKELQKKILLKKHLFAYFRW